MYALNMLEMALVLAVHDRAYEDIATKFFEHFAYIAAAAYEQRPVGRRGRLLLRRAAPAPTAAKVPLKVRSVVGLLPLAATTIVTSDTLRRLPELAEPAALVPDQQARVRRRARRPRPEPRRPAAAAAVGGRPGAAAPDPAPDARRGRSSCPPHGLRTLSRGAPGRTRSRSPRRQRLHRRLRAGASRPAACSAATPTGAARSGSRSTTCSSRRCAGYAEFFGDDLLVEYPTGSRTKLHACARSPTTCPAGWSRSSCTTPTAAGRSSATTELFQHDPRLARPDRRSTSTSTATPAPAWAPAHQTGWTALVVDLILQQGPAGRPRSTSRATSRRFRAIPAGRSTGVLLASRADPLPGAPGRSRDGLAGPGERHPEEEARDDPAHPGGASDGRCRRRVPPLTDADRGQHRAGHRGQDGDRPARPRRACWPRATC